MNKPNILFLNSKERHCGIYQYGKRCHDILKKSTRFNFIYAEISLEEEYFSLVNSTEPIGIIYNYYPLTMPWITSNNISNYPSIIHYALYHEDGEPQHIGFDYLLMVRSYFNDDKRRFAVPRPLVEGNNIIYVNPSILTVGSFGFGFGNKGFHKIVKLINEQFDEAIIRLNITQSFFGDRDGQKLATIISECQSEPRKPNVKLEINTNFLDDTALLNFLASNTFNIFLYEPEPGRNLSSVIDYIININKPLVISKSHMFRHLWDATPSICIEDRPLKTIINDNNNLLQKFRDKWSHSNFIKRYEDIIANTTIIRNNMNIILTDKQRDIYKNVINELFQLCPETMSRKIHRANVQQAFVLDTVRKLSTKNSKILSVGSYEDTASESLVKLGYNIKEIDPAINMDLNQFFNSTQEKYDTILSTSVIEHVENDELFIEQICQLLNNGGHAVITCDFRNDYVKGHPKPVEDYRLYTQNDLLVRFKSILDKNGCTLTSIPDYNYPPDFQYQSYMYSFATYVFRKEAK